MLHLRMPLSPTPQLPILTNDILFYNKTFIDPIEYPHDRSFALNGFSFNETGALSGAIEKTGQTTYMSTPKLVRILIFSSLLLNLISFSSFKISSKIGRSSFMSAWVLAVCCFMGPRGLIYPILSCDDPKITCLSSSKTCSIYDDSGCTWKQVRTTGRPREEWTRSSSFGGSTWKR